MLTTSGRMKVAVLVYSLILLSLGLFLWPQPVVASPSAVIESHSMWMDSLGTLQIFGEVRNTGDTWIQSIKITATLIDANGVTFGTEYNYLYPDSLPPSAVGPFNIWVDDQEKVVRVRSYSLFVDFKVAPPLPTKLAITGVSDLRNSMGYLEVVGEVENQGDQPSVNTQIFGTFYDATGKVIYVHLYDYPGTTISPGATWRFECGSLACLTVRSAEVTSRITRYSVIAESELYTSISELATSVTQSTTIAAPTSVTQSTSVVPQATSRSSASCLCDMEIDWVFDYGRTNTSITMRTTIHPGAGTWSSYAIHLPPSMVGYTASDASTNAILSVISVQEQSEVTTIVDFGGPKGDGWAYYVKFVDTGGGVNENKLTDSWDWASTYRLTHVFHLWLPTAYDVSAIVPARNYTIATLQGRVYVSFSGNPQPNEKYEWTLAAKRLTVPPNYPVTVTTIAVYISTGVTSTASSSMQARTSTSENLTSTQTMGGLFLGQNGISLGVAIAVTVAALTSIGLLLKRRKSSQVSAAPATVPVAERPAPAFRQPSQIFISYSSEDMEPAMQICKLLEQRGIGCWITPRDVMPGRSYGEEIINAIESTSATVLVLSEHANLSVHVKNEIERAVSKGKTIFPIRIREVQPSKALEFFISSAQWIDAFRPPLESQIDVLAGAIKLLKAGRK